MEKVIGIMVLGVIIFVIAFAIYKGPAFLDKFDGGLFKIATSSRSTGTKYYNSGTKVTPYVAPSSSSFSSPGGAFYGQIPSGFSEKDLSPYFGKITIGWVNRSGFFSFGNNTSYTEANFYINLSSGEKVDITGWKVESNKDYFLIPQAMSDYNPYIPYSPSNIIVSSGEQVRVFSHTNPTILANLRLNQCTGYLKGFNPELPQTCPYVSQSEIYTFSGACQSYIRSLSSCQSPIHNPPIPYNETACFAFLSKLNYAGCYDKYRSSSNFFSKEWRIWLGDSFGKEKNIFDPLHDRVLLFDSTGMLVDDYIY